MRFDFLKRYFSIIFIVATLLGVFHHHNDLKTHHDCKICTIQSNIVDADMPIKVIYVKKLDIINDPTTITLSHLCSKFTQNNISLRAPPYIF